MEKGYTPEELRRIAREMAEALRKAGEGAEATTALLARRLGYRDMEIEELFALEEELQLAAREAGISLDKSRHDGMFEGLPFNLEFVVRLGRD